MLMPRQTFPKRKEEKEIYKRLQFTVRLKNFFCTKKHTIKIQKKYRKYKEMWQNSPVMHKLDKECSSDKDQMSNKKKNYYFN